MMTSSTTITMKVEMPKRMNEAGFGRARLDPQAYSKLGLTIGDIIEIVGKKTVVAKVFRSDVEDEGTNFIRIDGLTRTSAEVSIGENVKVKKCEPSRAEKIVLEPKNEDGARLNVDRTFTEILKNNLISRPVINGMDITVQNISLMGARAIFNVVSTVPSGPVVVSSITDLVVLEEPEKQKNTTKTENGGVGRDNRNTTYDDIGGLNEELKRIREMCELPLKHPELFDRMGISAPKGLLLYGPPGTGKTLIAEALANESGATFFSVRGPEIMSGHYGESEGKLRSLFQSAKKKAPSIIFLDEIDSIAPNRENTYGEQERRIVAQLLSLMDGMGGRGNVIVIGATNREDSIDPALRRPGRFDREIEIGIPDRQGRENILGVHTRNMPLADDVDLAALSRITQGFVGADLAALAREAAMKCLSRFINTIDPDSAIPPEVLESMKVSRKDFIDAFGEVEPSGMREVSIEIPKITWDDIGGLEEIHKELKETLLPEEEKKDFERLGISPGKGVLLYGPPGTGKTLIAKAVANESGANFILVNGPELVSKWVGESELGIRKIFRRAKQMAPSIIFFDEIDSIAPKRNGECNTWDDRMVAQLLTSLDGVEQLNHVLVMAATNRPDMLDPALLRPGRIDRMILVGNPNLSGRLSILKVHTKNMPIGQDVDLETIADRTEGFVGADLFALCREAGLNAYRRNPHTETIDNCDFELALETIKPSVNDNVLEQYRQMGSEIKKRKDRWNDIPLYN